MKYRKVHSTLIASRKHCNPVHVELSRRRLNHTALMTYDAAMRLMQNEHCVPSVATMQFYDLLLVTLLLVYQHKSFCPHRYVGTLYLRPQQQLILVRQSADRKRYLSTNDSVRANLRQLYVREKLINILINIARIHAKS